MKSEALTEPNLAGVAPAAATPANPIPARCLYEPTQSTVARFLLRWSLTSTFAVIHSFGIRLFSLVYVFCFGSFTLERQMLSNLQTRINTFAAASYISLRPSLDTLYSRCHPGNAMRDDPVENQNGRRQNTIVNWTVRTYGHDRKSRCCECRHNHEETR